MNSTGSQQCESVYCFLPLPTDGYAASCTNPSGQAGKCLNIKQCPILLNLLRQQREIPGVADFLRASACGYEGRDPKVCCPGIATGTTELPPENNTTAPVMEPVRLPDQSECGIVGPGVEDRRVVGGYPAELGKCIQVQVCDWVLSHIGAD
jgi:transmembrane serine protease 9